MIDETNEVEVKQDNVPDVDYKSEYEKLKGDLDKYKKENNDFFSEMKTYKQKAKELEEKLMQGSKEKEEAKTYKERYESLDKQVKEKEQQWQEKQSQYDNERIRNKAMKLANELDPLNADAADMLADYIQRRLKMTDEGLAILDKDGKISNLKEEDLREEFKAMERYKPLLRGRDSTGSGAKNGVNAGGAGKFDQLNKLNPVDRLTALREAKTG
jgi:DNA repair exonuclease SbcCD ATPase subunit